MEIQIPYLPFLFALFLFVLTSIHILTKSSKTGTIARKLPPGPWKLPLVGNIHQLAGSLPHHKLRGLANKHGPLMYLKIGQVPTVVISSPDFSREMMITHDAIFAFRPRMVYAEILLYDCTDVVFAPYGEHWRQLRRICTQELLSPARVKSFRPIREEEMFSFMDWISSNNGSATNLTARIHSSTYGVTSRAAFGKRSRDHDEFISVVVEAAEAAGGFDLSELFPSLGWLRLVSGAKAKLERLKQRASRIMEDIIKDHEEKKKNTAENSGETEEDLVDVLLKFHNNNDLDFSLTTDNIKAVIWDIFSAGSETSATALNWAMAEMMKNPTVMKKAQDEVRQVFRTKGSVDETSIADMKYLKATVKETLRLHPSAPLLVPRECSENCEIGGFEIPKKAKVIVNAWAIGRDPKYWDDPERFLPERFLESAIDYRGTNFEYIPFGAGRRLCPGMLFGLINVELPLAMLLYHFDWKLADGMEPQDLDMAELFGVTVGKKQDLNLIPVAYDLSPIEKYFSGRIN